MSVLWSTEYGTQRNVNISRDVAESLGEYLVTLSGAKDQTTLIKAGIAYRLERAV